MQIHKPQILVGNLSIPVFSLDVGIHSQQGPQRTYVLVDRKEDLRKNGKYMECSKIVDNIGAFILKF